MAFIGLRVDSAEMDYIKQLIANRRFSNISDAVRFMIKNYQNSEGIQINIPNEKSNVFYSFYNKFVPFVFGILFLYAFAILKTWFFIPMLFIAVLPFFFPLELTDDNNLKLVMPNKG